MARRPPLVVTMGEPAGIGPELLLAAWRARPADSIGPWAAIANADQLRALAGRLDWPVPIIAIAAPDQAEAALGEGLPVIDIPLGGSPRAGAPDPINAAATIASIDRAVAMAMDGRAAAVVTNPIQKSALYAAGFSVPGHTEYLAQLTGAPRPVMMIAGPRLRVVPVTIHLPLALVPTALTTEAIVETGRIALIALRADFGIAEPRLAVCGLNPHAGESGALGQEDEAIVRPAVEALAAEGWRVTGPHPADTLFHQAARAGFDAALGMYHDQVLTPAKALDFDQGVNVTLGLPIVRTSPDHGTALDIAGHGVARADSLLAAMAMARDLATTRAAARP